MFCMSIYGYCLVESRENCMRAVSVSGMPSKLTFVLILGTSSERREVALNPKRPRKHSHSVLEQIQNGNKAQERKW